MNPPGLRCLQKFEVRKSFHPGDCGRRNALVGLFQEPRPIFDRALEATYVYVVERFFFEGPVELAVVNLEVYIGRYPSAR
jgi:hypothetical protein